MARRRLTREQRANILAARAKQRRACARGNHWWNPDHHCNFKNPNRVEPRFWSTNERYPMPTWDKKTVVCQACNVKGNLNDIPSKRQKIVKEMFNDFVECTISLRKRREQELKEK